MALTLEFRTSSQAKQWTISTSVTYALEQIAKSGLKGAVSVLWDESVPTGEPRRVSRNEVLEAIEQMMPAANKVAKEFRMHFRYPNTTEDLTGRGTRGIIINGVSYWIWCEDDYWTITPDGNISVGTAAYKQFLKKKGPPRRDTAEFQTENFGLIRMEPTKGKADIAKLLAQLRKFLRSLHEKTLQVTIG